MIYYGMKDFPRGIFHGKPSRATWPTSAASIRDVDASAEPPIRPSAGDYCEFRTPSQDYRPDAQLLPFTTSPVGFLDATSLLNCSPRDERGGRPSSSSGPELMPTPPR